MSSGVSADRRFRKSHPCPICGGSHEVSRGTGQRCYGFRSDDGQWAHCTREEYAGALHQEEGSQTYAHRLIGDCRCGTRHDHTPPQTSSNGHQKPRIVATYLYTDEQGSLLYQVVREDPKDFKQRRPDGQGDWIWSTKGVRRVLYGLPEVQEGIAAGKVICIAEGEEDVHALGSHGYTATCNDGGAKKWTDAHSDQMRGASEVVIFGDHDEDGRLHVAQVMRSLQTVGNTAHVARIEGLPEKGDIRDWLKTHGQGDLNRLVADTLATTEHHHSMNGNGQAANPLVLTKLADLLAEPEEAVDWLVDGLLPSGGFSLLAAKPKVGKSTLARCLALAVARGEVFLGRATAKGPVIYLALEEKRSEVRKHFHAMGATGEEEIYVYAATAPADALPKIRVVVEEKKPVLLIIDPLFRFTRVKDGNDYAQVTQALEPILALARETGVHVLVVHHLSTTT